jgi:hypothetical protein
MAMNTANVRILNNLDDGDGHSGSILVYAIIIPIVCGVIAAIHGICFYE